MDNIKIQPVDLGKPIEFKSKDVLLSSQDDTRAKHFSQLLNDKSAKKHAEINGKPSAKVSQQNSDNTHTLNTRNKKAAKELTATQANSATDEKFATSTDNSDDVNVDETTINDTKLEQNPSEKSKSSATEKTQNELPLLDDSDNEEITLDQSVQVLTLLANAENSLQVIKDKAVQATQTTQQFNSENNTLKQADEQENIETEQIAQDKNTAVGEEYDEGIVKPKIANMEVINEKILTATFKPTVPKQSNSDNDNTPHNVALSKLTNNTKSATNSESNTVNTENNQKILAKGSEFIDMPAEPVVEIERLKSEQNNQASTFVNSDTTKINATLEKVADQSQPQAKQPLDNSNLNIDELEKQQLTQQRADKYQQPELENSTKVINQSTKVSQEAAEKVNKEVKSVEQALKTTQESTVEEVSKSEALLQREVAINSENRESINSLNKNVFASSLFAQQTNDTAKPSNYSTAELQEIQSLTALANKVTEVNLHEQKVALTKQVETIAIYRKDFVNNLQDKVLVMVQQKLQQVDIRLDPPELGQMQVKLHLHNDQASIQFIVQNQQAKEALDQNMPKLREMLAEQGVNVGDANVGQQSDGHFDNEENESQLTSREALLEDEAAETSHVFSAQVVKGSTTGVDYYA
jgi:flagellar hook-length control protein FliK